jgi:hypothetical protein
VIHGSRHQVPLLANSVLHLQARSLKPGLFAVLVSALSRPLLGAVSCVLFAAPLGEALVKVLYDAVEKGRTLV